VQIGPAEKRQLRQALGTFEEVRKAVGDNHLGWDARFHGIIMRASGNQRLASFIDTLRDIQQVRGVSTVGVTRRLRDIYDDHALICNRILAGDPAGAATAMRDHILGTAQLLLAQQTGDVEDAPRFDVGWLDGVAATRHRPPRTRSK
jgi:DNA-binding GntR family transcriptional regulator